MTYKQKIQAIEWAASQPNGFTADQACQELEITIREFILLTSIDPATTKAVWTREATQEAYERDINNDANGWRDELLWYITVDASLTYAQLKNTRWICTFAIISCVLALLSLVATAAAIYAQS